MDSKKGQSVSIDFVFGLFVFMILLVYLVITSHELAERFTSNAYSRMMEASAIGLSNALATGGGEPYNWSGSPESASAIGLAQKPGVLDQAKIDALSSMPYESAKRALGLEWDYQIRVEDRNGFRRASVGLDNITSDRVIEVTRVALLDGKTVYLRVRLYGS